MYMWIYFVFIIWFFFNALLYSDVIISHKYHNNGNLEFFFSLILSILSNIITSIVCFFIRYSNGVEEKLDEILNIMQENKFLTALNKYFTFFKYRMLFYIIIEIILVGICFYYIFIFSILYSKSQLSLIFNYIYSLIEGLITSLFITILIVITRQIGLNCSNSYLYNISKYFNDNF